MDRWKDIHVPSYNLLNPRLPVIFFACILNSIYFELVENSNGEVVCCEIFDM